MNTNACIFCGEIRKVYAKNNENQRTSDSQSPQLSYICEKCLWEFWLEDVQGRLGKLHFFKGILGDMKNIFDELNKNSALNEMDTEEEATEEEAHDVVSTVNHEEIYNYLRRFVIGQDNALKQVGFAISINNLIHEKKITEEKPSIDAKAILFIGPTGVGKSYTLKCLANFLRKPYAFLNCGNLTAPGFVGGDLESSFYDLYISADRNVSKAENGIIFLDEIDKLASSNFQDDRISQMSKAAQQSLLMLIEGCKIEALKYRNVYEKSVSINTKNILFIGSGAFSRLEKIVSKRKARNRSTSNVFGDSIVFDEDLISYGFLPELAGRFPFRVCFDPMGEGTLVKILEMPNSPLKIHQKYFTEHVVSVNDGDIYRKLAQMALQQGAGARSLWSVVHEYFRLKISKGE
ncbi:AAA family ATPase [Dethiosulfatarculus sandiegensis]|uniref:AAA+ ATPase domain-containing protein n=1 Tax=Dethiosulfatarculus sandiegensis TaxID=1429043 RepID=A0A0D2HQ95_9BACT|nr:AAA family ATPase [Dethiosulfatarculus sandiegensis]KIX12648.1 hypothetical protein X474_18055 [Dethiosulfatarculus sandiegensis]